MKSLAQLDSWIAAKVRGWSGKLAGTPQTMELLEIRRGVLNEIRDHIQPKGEGRSIFPFNRIAIGMPAETFTEPREWEETVSSLLTEAGCALPGGLRVVVSVLEPGVDLGGCPFRVRFSNEAEKREVKPRPAAKLTVLRGEADATEFAIDSERINIGRMKEVISGKEGLRRRNDVAFSETETTVSREHASIIYEGLTGEFRLYDSWSRRGTQVFRAGRRFEVPKSPVHGFQLRSGDEIHLGDARVRFELLERGRTDQGDAHGVRGQHDRDQPAGSGGSIAKFMPDEDTP